MSGLNDIILDNKYISTSIPYNMKVSRYNRNAYDLMKGYYYNEIKDIAMLYNDEDPKQASLYGRIHRQKTVEDIEFSIERLYKNKINCMNSNIIKKKKRQKIVNWVSPVIKCYDEERKCLAASTIIDIRCVGVMDFYKVKDNRDHIIYSTAYSSILHYSEEFRSLRKLLEGNIIKCFDPWEEKPSNSQILVIEILKQSGSAYALQLERPTLHPIINGIIFKSTVFEDEEDKND